MNQIAIQTIFKSAGQPNRRQIQRWVDAALEGSNKTHSCVVRIVDEQESAQLNEQYRHTQGPTNILSFPVEVPDGIELDLLGDLVICAPVVKKEALEQHKILAHHWAHMIVHGILHLLGYDHIDDDEAEQMESKEIAILKKLNISNPYTEVKTHE
ncbi:MAG: rRNA maturation RNase YbeY [Methylobacter sp.]|nr:rRNA maturation RNase YbeY [Methylobacter sp.]